MMLFAGAPRRPCLGLATPKRPMPAEERENRGSPELPFSRPTPAEERRSWFAGACLRRSSPSMPGVGLARPTAWLW
jgi:hypothetical protein